MPDPVVTGWRDRVDAALARILPATDPRPPDASQRPADIFPVNACNLHAAMRHAVLPGGKRMRPLLVYASGCVFDANALTLDAPAVAVELIHAYSLVHDDLPAMDDDALRRGRQTVHVAFGEATAILAGDALQALAFTVLADTPADDAVRIELLRTLASAAGASGMCGGQALDLAATGAMGGMSLSQLEHLHALKTGALIRAAVRMGGLCGGADCDALALLDRFANALGLAFQVRDDILDVEGDSATLGKTIGKDVAQRKATFPALIGMDASRRRLVELRESMRDALTPFGTRGDELAALGRMAVERDR